MQFLCFFVFNCMLLLWLVCFGHAIDCQLHDPNPYKVAYTITVDQSGKGNFTTLQSAIDSIPEGNTQWIRIQISPGIYNEKVEISVKKPCIFLEGAGRNSTSIEWGDHEATYTSPTFTSYPESIIVKGVTIKNTFHLLKPDGVDFAQAVAARIKGDKCVLYESAFIGLQDTFWDEKGRHYLSKCYFEGAIDFIFGKAESIYEECEISVNREKYQPGLAGFITAQKKEWATQSSGFVFKNCVFDGVGKTFFGRAWAPYATVIIYNSTISVDVIPEGWSAWDYTGQEANIMYVEADNQGPGADTSKRVSWLKKLDADQLQSYLNVTTFIDGDGWLSKLPVFSN